MFRRTTLAILAIVVLPQGNLKAETTTSVHLNYEAPSPECPNEETFQDAVRSRLGSNPFADQGFEVVLRITAEGQTYTGQISIRTHADQRPLERRIQSEGEGCEPLAETLAMTLSVLLDPTAGLLPTIDPEIETRPAEEPGPTLETTHPSDRQQADAEHPWGTGDETSIEASNTEEQLRSRLSLLPGAGLRLGLGRGPGLTLGPVLGFGVSVGSFVFSLQGQADFTIAKFWVENNGELDVFVLSGGLDFCYRVSFFEICLTGDVGALQAEPFDGALGTRIVGFVGSDLGFNIEIGHTILRILLGIELSLARTTVYINEIQVWTTPLVVGHLGFEVRFGIPLTDPQSSSEPP